jgi:acetate kinase
MKSNEQYVLALNAGSSSIKFALYQISDPPKGEVSPAFGEADPLKRMLEGKIDRIGLPGTNLTFKNPAKNHQGHQDITASNHKTAADSLIGWLAGQIDMTAVRAVGHRVVHGMKYVEPARVTQKLLNELRRIRSYDPEHLPREIKLIEQFRRRFPKLLQVACFDTAFHRTMPRVAKLLPIPRRFDKMGIQRYGFHGLSYTYLLEELAHTAGKKAARGRVILAHLGNGASMAAVRDGKSIDTSMGFTPTGGLPMSTRTGDLDPGVAWFLMRTENLTPRQFNNLVNKKSGLLGVSETSPDMRDLLEQQAGDVRAAEAVELFCYQARKWVGAFSAALGGLDTLVFSGGIGENAGEVRARICAGLEFLGIELDEAKNAENAEVISRPASKVTVRVIRTDEELMIARILCRFVQNEKNKKKR